MATKKKSIQRFTAWSPSRLADYEQCPLMAKLKHLDKLCPLCFKGKIMGGYDTPAVCDSCGGTIKKGEALERGTEIGDNLDRYVTGKGRVLHSEIRHPKVQAIIKQVKSEIKQKLGRVQVNLQLTRSWEIFDGPGWSPEIWLRAKLDYQRVTGAVAHVTDWKTGGIDKRTGAVKASEKYDDQLMLYNLVTLCAEPGVKAVTSDLVFLDCGPRFDPVVERPGLERSGIEAAKKHFEKKTFAMMVDDTFAPRANGACAYCPYRTAKGGPCRF